MILRAECPSVLRPVTYSNENIPIPTPSPVSEQDNNSSLAKSIDFSQTSKSSASIASTYSDEKPHSSQSPDVPQLLNQNDLNDLVRDFGLTKKKIGALIFKIETMEYVAERSQLHLFLFQTRKSSRFFSVHNNVCYCSNIDGFFKTLESKHYFTEWKLIIDLSKASLKVVLLNNGNKKPSIPLVHASALKESQPQNDGVNSVLNYFAYYCNICGGLKVFFLACRLIITSINAFCVFGTVATMSNITSKKIGI